MDSERESDYKISRTVLEQLTKDAFDVFDVEGTSTIDPKDVGSIIRFLGLNPSEAQIKDMITEVFLSYLSKQQLTVDDKVPFDKLQEKLILILMNNAMKRDDETKIKQAFRVIDQERSGFIDASKLAHLLMTMGEPFTQEEVDEMFSVAVDQKKGIVRYNEYASVLAND